MRWLNNTLIIFTFWFGHFCPDFFSVGVMALNTTNHDLDIQTQMRYTRLEKKAYLRQIGQFRPAFNGKYLLLFSRGKNGIMYSFFALACTYILVVAHLLPSLSSSSMSINTCNRTNTPPAVVGSRLSMNYIGRIAASSKTGVPGLKFDSSYDRHLTFDFTLGQGRVIQGWDEGLLGVCPGDEKTLVIPPEKGYGDRGAPPSIPGGATLRFDVVVESVVSSSGSLFSLLLFGLWMTLLTGLTMYYLSMTWLTEPGVCVNPQVHEIYVDDGRPRASQPKWMQSFLKGLRKHGKKGDKRMYRPIEKDDDDDDDDDGGRRSNARRRPPPPSNLGTELVDLDFPVIRTSIEDAETTLGGRSGPLGELDQRLLLSTADGDEGTVRELLELGAEPNVTNAQSRSPLHLAGYRGYTDIVVLLLKRGAWCGRPDSFGLTELHYALVNGHDDTAELLLNHGAMLEEEEEEEEEQEEKKEGDGGGSNGRRGSSSSSSSSSKTSQSIKAARHQSTIEQLRNRAIVTTNAALTRHAAENKYMSPARTQKKRNSTSRETKSPPLTQQKSIITRSGAEVKLVWCHVCKHFKPMLAHHSETCGVCIDGFEQYCRFVSNAIGRRNYKYYVALLLSSSVLSLSCLLPSLAFVLQQSQVVDATTGRGVLHQHAWVAFLALWSLILCVPLCSLLAYHLTAITSNHPVAYALYNNVMIDRRRYDNETVTSSSSRIARLAKLFAAEIPPSSGWESVTAAAERDGEEVGKEEKKIDGASASEEDDEDLFSSNA